MIGAVDIGGSKVAVGLVTAGATVAASRLLPAAEVCIPGAMSINRVLDTLEELAAAHAGNLEGIGIACTGPVDPATGVIGRVGTIPHWNGLNLTAAFHDRFHVPVAVENDADAAALAEWQWGCGRGASRFLYVTVSTGIGGGAILDGALYRGAGGSHPEIGHHVVEASGPECYCGGRGCWEMFAAGPALAARYARAAARDGCTAREVCELASLGDPAALDAVDHAAFYLGVGLANLVTMFAPEVIALGGGVMESWPLFERRARQTLGTNCRLVPVGNTRLAPASLGADLPLAGAACAWFHKYS